MIEKKRVEEKVQKLSGIITDLEKKIAFEKINFDDVDSITDKILNLKRKLGIYREILEKYSSPTVSFKNVC